MWNRVRRISICGGDWKVVVVKWQLFQPLPDVAVEEVETIPQRSFCDRTKCLLQQVHQRARNIQVCSGDIHCTLVSLRYISSCVVGM